MNLRKLKRKRKQNQPGPQNSREIVLQQELQHGMNLHQQGAYPEAKKIYQAILDIEPNHTDALNLLGTIAIHYKEYEKAISLITMAITLQPNNPYYYNNIGVANKDCHSQDAAISAFAKAIELKPDLAEAYFNLGDIYKTKGELDKAADLLEQGLQYSKKRPDVLKSIGRILLQQDKLAEAEKRFAEGLQLTPKDVGLLCGYGKAIGLQGNIEKEMDLNVRALTIAQNASGIHSNILYLSNFLTNTAYDKDIEKSLVWWDQLGANLSGAFQFQNHLDFDRCLKIGYVSPDFREHSVSHFFLPLLKKHNRSKVKVFCYSETSHKDEITEQIKKLSDRWLNISQMTSAEAADHIHADQIDILIDLAGHTAEHDLSVFARSPAPIMVSWLGYPNTTGISKIDYRITDSIADPKDNSTNYAESLLRLPGCFLSFSPTEEFPLKRKRTYDCESIVFGSFNNFLKINMDVIDVWSEILQQTKGSKLMLKGRGITQKAFSERIINAFKKNGIPEECIILKSWIKETIEHKELYNEIDIALDPFPYNGTTTTFEALWAGIPVIALNGDSHRARVSASILTHLDMKDNIGKTKEDYIKKAVSLAGNRQRLEEFHRTLRNILSESSLCDHRGFADKMENTYRDIWTRWVNNKLLSKAPASQGKRP